MKNSLFVSVLAVLVMVIGFYMMSQYVFPKPPFLSGLAFISSLTKLIRALATEEQKHPSHIIEAQIKNFHTRLHFIQIMEASGIVALLLSISSTLALYLDCQLTGKVLFLSAIGAVFVSLSFALLEVIISTKALHIELHAKLGHQEKKGLLRWLGQKHKK